MKLMITLMVFGALMLNISNAKAEFTCLDGVTTINRLLEDPEVKDFDVASTSLANLLITKLGLVEQRVVSNKPDHLYIIFIETTYNSKFIVLVSADKNDCLIDPFNADMVFRVVHIDFIRRVLEEESRKNETYNSFP